MYTLRGIIRRTGSTQVPAATTITDPPTMAGTGASWTSERERMKFVQYYLDCLSQASYLVGDETTGRAVIVDPRRDVREYVEDARSAGLTIEMIIETHFHADFLSGHLELARATGAGIAFGEAATADFPIRKLRDGERISLGEVTLEILSTPGHTPESICVVVHEKPDAEAPYGVLTGDTLFIGDVGRPDLLGSVGYSAEQMARMLNHSLREKLLPLPDVTKVYPAHGAGSACGKNLSTDTVSTIGQQRQFNYALQPMTEDEFVGMVTEGQPTTPNYFLYDAVLNRRERDLFDEQAEGEALSLEQVLQAQAAGAVVLDVRDADEYAKGHLKGSIQAGLSGRFAENAGSVVPHDAAIVLVAPPETEMEAKIRLARIGFDNVLGYLADPAAALNGEAAHIAAISRLSAREAQERLAAEPAAQLVDVRNPGEVASGMVEGAIHIPLAKLGERHGELNGQAPVILYCRSGYRSAVAASVLEAAGFADVSDVIGGYDAFQPATV